MRLIFTLAFIHLYCFASGQSKYPSKLEVDKVIGLTISQKMTKKNISCENGQCGEWWAANKDSIFYKSDTVKFYNSSNIVYSDTTFCTSVVWDFDKANDFNDGEALMCQEPPMRTIRVPAFLSGQKNKVKIPNGYGIVSKANKTFIYLYNDKEIFAMFKIIDLSKTIQQNLGDKSYVLTLVRQKFGRR